MHTVTLKKWGNSAGVIIPAEDMKAAGAYVGEKFHVVPRKDGAFLLKPILHPHAGWTEAFNAIAAAGDDQLLLGDAGTEFDEDEWV